MMDNNMEVCEGLNSPLRSTMAYEYVAHEQGVGMPDVHLGPSCTKKCSKAGAKATKQAERQNAKATTAQAQEH